jgi:hypothetical protein
VGVILPCNNYSDLIQSLFEHIHSRPEDIWVYVTITRPFESIVKKFGDLSSGNNIKFIDCISRAAGLSKIDQNCIFIESPAHLEKIIIEILNIFRNIGDNVQKYLVIDSLSSLLIYNDAQLVTEFFTHLINRTRLSDIHSVSIAIDEEMDDNINKILYLRSDKIIRLKESFI